MSKASEVARCLFPFAIGSALGAVSYGAASMASAAAKIVGQVVAGLAVNYASAWISPVLGTFS